MQGISLAVVVEPPAVRGNSLQDEVSLGVRVVSRVSNGDLYTGGELYIYVDYMLILSCFAKPYSAY